MVMEVPFIVFKTPRGRFAIDAYFTEFVSLEPRKVVLIKDPEKEGLLDSASDPLPVLLKEDVREFLIGLFTRLEEAERGLRERRISHMRRWNALRIIGIPTGHSRHIAMDERLGEAERENSFGLALLKSILGVRSSEELSRIRVTKEGIAYRVIWLEKGEVLSPVGKDAVYTNLLRKDPVFRTAFHSALFRRTLLNKEMGEKAQDFSYSQQAT